MTDWTIEYTEQQKLLKPLQDDPDFVEFMSFMEPGLKAFFTTLVPDMPAEPYSEAGLVHAEDAALRLFPDADLTIMGRSEDTARMIDPFRRYLGEVFVRNFDGQWVNSIEFDTIGPEPVVAFPYSMAHLQPRTALTKAVRRRKGGQWAAVFRNQLRRHEAWVTSGRPPTPEAMGLWDSQLFGTPR